MQSYQGNFDNGQFVAIGTASIPERRRVILTVLDEPAPIHTVSEPSPIHTVSEPSPIYAVSKHAEAWKEFFETVNASDEEVPESFERINFSRELDL